MVSYSSQAVKQLPSTTDWQRIQAMSEEAIETNAPDDLGEAWLNKAKLVAPTRGTKKKRSRSQSGT